MFISFACFALDNANTRINWAPANELTYVVSISYAYANGYVYVHTHEGMKVNTMCQNPKVCFVVQPMENMANHQSVVAGGNFEEITDETACENAPQILLKRNLPIIINYSITGYTILAYVSNRNINNIIGRIVFALSLLLNPNDMSCKKLKLKDISAGKFT